MASVIIFDLFVNRRCQKKSGSFHYVLKISAMEEAPEKASSLSFPMFVRKRNNRWDDLKDHHFTVAEKEYVAQEIIDERVTLGAFLSRHNMKNRSKTVRDWVKRIRDGRKLYEFAGQPPVIDIEGQIAVKFFVNNGGASENQMLSPSQREVKVEIRKQVRE